MRGIKKKLTYLDRFARKYYCEHANALTVGKANGKGITFSITADNLLNVSVEE